MYEQALVSLYERAHPPVRRRGRSWYPELNRRLQVMADENGHSLAQAAAVCAITSVDAVVILNLRWTEEILRGERTYGKYPSQRDPIAAALMTRFPGRFVRGPKCSAYYRAIMGDTTALVLDRWAIKAAGIVQKRHDLGAILRREVDAAYRESAAACGETVRAFQAIAWLAVREATYPQLADITS